jgi:hypothetical protein
LSTIPPNPEQLSPKNTNNKLQKNDALKAGYLDAFSASRIAAPENIVNTNHVIACSFETHAIIFIRVLG